LFFAQNQLLNKQVDDDVDVVLTTFLLEAKQSLPIYLQDMRQMSFSPSSGGATYFAVENELLPVFEIYHVPFLDHRRHTPYFGSPDFRIFEMNKRLQQRSDVSHDDHLS